MRRYKLGTSGDPWTEEARNRLEKIGLLEATGQAPEARTMGKETDRQRALADEAEELLEKKWLGEERYRAREIRNLERKEKVLARKKREEERRRQQAALKQKRQEEQRKSRVEKERFLEEKTKNQQRLKQKRQEEIEKIRLDRERLQEKQRPASKKEETPGVERSRPSATKSTEVEGTLSEIENKTEQDIKSNAGREARWTKIGPSRDTAARKPEERQVKKQRKSSDKPFEEKLQASLALAEERLRNERMKETIEKNSREPETRPSAETNKFYSKAQSYYQHGEYAKALDEIRSGKRANPQDGSLLALEEKIKDKMKEERIKDLYNEGMMRYQQEDFSGAREEFESILNILPE